MWRHGDVLIAAVDALPRKAKRRHTTVLVHGELTGHSHRLEDPTTGELWDVDGVLYLRVTAPSARVVHQEHAPITLAEGTYRVWQQREYSPEAIRRVVD
jgi:hypothetical protein